LRGSAPVIATVMMTGVAIDRPSRQKSRDFGNRK
jgi:hypothetical protein